MRGAIFLETLYLLPPRYMLQRTFKNMLAHSSESLCQWESCVYPWWMLLSCHSYSGIPIQCNSEHAIPYFYSFFGIYICMLPIQYNCEHAIPILYYIIGIFKYLYIHTYIYILWISITYQCCTLFSNHSYSGNSQLVTNDIEVARWLGPLPSPADTSAGLEETVNTL